MAAILSRPQCVKCIGGSGAGSTWCQVRSSYYCMSHSFLSISPGLITLSPASIRHIKHAYARKSTARAASRSQKYNFDPIFSTQSKRFTAIHEDLFIIYIWRYYDVIWLSDPELRSVYRDSCVWEYWINKMGRDSSSRVHVGLVRQFVEPPPLMGEWSWFSHDF